MYVWMIRSEGMLFIHGKIDCHDLKKMIKRYIEGLQDQTVGEKCRCRQKKTCSKIPWGGISQNQGRDRHWYCVTVYFIFHCPWTICLQIMKPEYEGKKINSSSEWAASCPIFSIFFPTSSVVFTNTYNKGN